MTPPAPTSRGRRLRDLIAAPAILVMPGVFDGFSARLVEARGFAAALVSGAGLSESRLGRPDVGLMGLHENLDGTRAIADCTNLSLIADADTGYGNAVNVYHAVRAFEAAGVAGVMIEDQVWPKRCGHLDGKEVVDAQEMVQKVLAAVDARRDPDFVIKARTDAAGPLGIEEAVRRATLYARAGADLVFADALTSEADIERFCREVPAPACINMGFGIRTRSSTPLLSARRLQELGAAVVIVPRLLTAAAVRGMLAAMDVFEESLRTGVAADRPDLSTDFETLYSLMGFPQVQELERRFLSQAELQRKYGSGR
ncbi:MAG: isocitrate lyase/PEP mutase family protein [Candidatus Dormibacteraceae bacterium]